MRIKRSRIKRSISLLLGVALIAAGLAACGGGDTGGTPNAGTPTTEAEPSGNAAAPSGDAVRSAKVEISASGYDPDPVTIETGGKVIWINRDSTTHTARAGDGSFDTGPIKEGKIKSETFKQPGTYEYFSSSDPQLHGTVVVVEPR
jgi:plastocyanin